MKLNNIYIALFAGLLIVSTAGSYLYMRQFKSDEAKIVAAPIIVGTTTNPTPNFVTGNVSATFEGVHTASYGVLVSENIKSRMLSTSKDKKQGKEFASGTDVALLHFSYEGGRGLDADGYIDEVINKDKPNVQVSKSLKNITSFGTSTVWSHYVVSGREYYITPLGEFLAIVEGVSSSTMVVDIVNRVRFTGGN